MKILLVTEWFAEGLGYSENCLPKALANLGHEVHLVSSNVKPYFDRSDYAEAYEPFIGPPFAACGSKMLDGYWLHRLPYQSAFGLLRVRGLIGLIRRLQPDVVQTFDVGSLPALDAALASVLLRTPLFLEAHMHASVLSLVRKNPGHARAVARFLYPRIIGGILSARATTCFAISSDAAEVAVHYSRIRRAKVRLCSLGVDTALFHPADDLASQAARRRLRAELGFTEDEIVCIYTGRFSREKGPLVLAQAVSKLARAGHPFRALLVGGGSAEEVVELEANYGSVVLPFMPFRELPCLYRCGDVGVWPTQESTSQLDAAASGLPLVLSDRTSVTERVADNGLLYPERDVDGLAARLLELRDPHRRREMGRSGAQRIRALFSWERIAREREADYRGAIASRSRKAPPAVA